MRTTWNGMNGCSESRAPMRSKQGHPKCGCQRGRVDSGRRQRSKADSGLLKTSTLTVQFFLCVSFVVKGFCGVWLVHVRLQKQFSFLNQLEEQQSGGS